MERSECMAFRMDLTFIERKCVLAKKHIDGEDEHFLYPHGICDAKKNYPRICLSDIFKNGNIAIDNTMEADMTLDGDSSNHSVCENQDATGALYPRAILNC